ncbi:T-complex protein 1 subunit theta-like [Octopus sinensis]|uniref:T-complex protein 1 subunit theta-like n=1 Tax=Octopus sinensis TaxID=2607531 RepID=A0A7E6EJ96_9MOLL|nr:T-complex protein 1 subunit theta-like [Octopus sinensis]
MVINYLEKLFVTSDASTIVKELDVQHPACKLVVMAIQHQERECGDGTTQVLLLCVNLLENAAKLLKSGLPLKDVISGFQNALDFCLKTLPGVFTVKYFLELVVDSPVDLKDKNSQVKAIAETGCNVVVSIGKVGDMYRHFANKHGLVLIRFTSKFDLRRLCLLTGATPLPRLVVPDQGELGRCDSVHFEEIGSTHVVLFKQTSLVSTVILRGSSDHIMLDVEKAVDDGINAFKSLTRDNRLLPGGGAVELELANRLNVLSCPGALEQCSLAMLGVVRQIGDNGGLKGTVNALLGEHVKGSVNAGYIAEGDSLRMGDVVEAGLFDLYNTKHWVIKNAFNTAITILRIDEVRGVLYL